MRKKNFKRIAAAALALMMAMPTSLTAVQAETSTQMASEKEIVYVNAYGADVREQNFDDNWKFYLGDATGAESSTYDDSTWRTVTLPHDYSIEQEYTKSGEAESAYLPGGTGWYRKHFSVSSDMEGKEVRIDFGGVYMNATVWVNGTQLGTHPYGYTPFSFDISDYLNYDGENILTVKVDHRTPSSRWYSGSGIYRSVYLTVMDKVHVDLYGTNITTPNLEAEQGGTVNMTVATTVANEGTEAKDVVLTHTIYEKGTETSIGTVTTDAQSVAAGAAAEITATLPASNPALWDIDNPNLYTVVTEVKVGDAVVDTYESEYGFRYFSFNNNTGFTLNGEPLKLKGVCMHHDQGSLGAEAHYRATERQVEILKEMGCNAIRVTHNPASDEMIEACNKLGMLVIEEAFDGWLDVKNGNSNDYSNWFDVAIEDGNQIIGAEADMTWAEFDIKAMVSRGQNAPSIIMWSLGNEVQEGTYWESTSTYDDVAAQLIGWVEEIDESRLVTNGDNELKNNRSELVAVDTVIYQAGGVVGANYASGSQYDTIHSRYPSWPIYGSETASHVNSRGVYDRTSGGSQTSDKQLTSYDYSAVGWGAVASSAWYDVITRDFVAGEFVWTGFDYMGEPTPWNGTGSGAVGSWTSPKNSFFGIIDTAGLPKDNYYFYQSQWNEDVTTLHVLPAWNEDVVVSSTNVPVVVYSDAASVKLTFTAADGTVTDLGTKTFTKYTTDAGFTYQMYEGSDKESTTHRNMYLTWYVPYADGTITATAYDESGNVISDTEGRSYVTTTGAEAKLQAEVDRDTIDADGKDLAYITVDVTDADGNIVPDAANQVTFEVEGDGVLVGVDNGKQADHQSFQDDNRAAYNGSLIAIVQATKEAGEFTVTATADGLESASVTVTTEDTGANANVSFYMSKNYYVGVGEVPVLPETIETIYADGTSEELPVVWNEIPAEDYAEPGTFTVGGTVDGKYVVSVTVNVIDEVGGLLNYSTTTIKGVVPTLPAARPVVLVDGTILEATFAVTWDEVAAEDFAEVGTVVVNGTADVLGEMVDVTASVRVQEESLQIGDSISGMALTVTQDIEESMQSDTLSAIYDGDTVIADNNEGGDNPTAWSNYNNSQAGDDTAEIVFEYATQQRIGEIVIYFWKDGYSAEYPDAGTTEILISDDGTNWTTVEATETIGSENSRVKPYTYSFNPVTATFVKFCFTNSSATKTAEACTGITEIEINGAIGGGYTTNTAAGLESLVVNRVLVSEADLAAGEYYTADETANITATSKENAAVTILPVYDGKVVIITESEDHLTRETFTVYVGQEKPEDPSDSSNDVALEDMTYTTGSEQPASGNEGPIAYAFDNNEDTFWHSEWTPSWSSSAFADYLWVEFILEEATVVDAIRYLPRGGNGDITAYRVEAKTAESGDEWVTLTEGTWDKADTSWKLAKFDAVEVTSLRLVATGTYADSGNNRFASARELRVREAVLPTIVVDKSELAAAITAAEALVEADYTEATWADFQAALDEAKAVNADAEATQDAVDAAKAALADAQAALEEKENPTPDPDPVNPFEDVNESQYCYDAILWAVDKGVTSGLTPTIFGVGADCTREQIVTFLWNYAGKPAATETSCTFTDVAANGYYYNALLWANENGYVSGYNANTFGVGQPCTREQIVSILYRYAGSPAVTATSCDFTDVPAGAYYYNAILWAVENGITAGINDTTFGVGQTCTREQIVTFLYRYDAE